MYTINGFPVIAKENFPVFTTLCSHLISNTKCLIHVVHTVSILGYIKVKWLVPIRHNEEISEIEATLFLHYTSSAILNNLWLFM